MKKKVITWISLILCFSLIAFLMNVKYLEENAIAREFSFDSSSEIMSYDELVIQIAENDKKTIEEVEKGLGPQTSEAKLGTYRALYQLVDVKSVYKAQVRFYVETSESGLFHGIKRIMHVNMNRAKYGIASEFAGTINYVLTDPNNIHYSIDGDFFNSGNTTLNIGENVSLGEHGLASYSGSFLSNHFAYSSQAGDRQW